MVNATRSQPTPNSPSTPARKRVARGEPRTGKGAKTRAQGTMNEDHLLGQFIPLHYHYQMLNDANRTAAFKAAIQSTVLPGNRVLELGGGTGVLSYFAAEKAERVYCVERLAANASAARTFLERNGVSDRVTVVEADAFEYLPPEPVDVVICEMLHSAMLREKQIPMIKGFKERYLQRFGGPLPRFIPEALIMGVQAIQQDYDFAGFNAPVPLFSDASDPRVSPLSDPAAYALFPYDEDFGTRFAWEGILPVQHAGTVNALRFITKNVLAVVMDESPHTIDWHMHYLVLPLETPFEVEPGSAVGVRFAYDAGDSIESLITAIEVGPM